MLEALVFDRQAKRLQQSFVTVVVVIEDECFAHATALQIQMVAHMEFQVFTWCRVSILGMKTMRMKICRTVPPAPSGREFAIQMITSFPKVRCFSLYTLAFLVHFVNEYGIIPGLLASP